MAGMSDTTNTTNTATVPKATKPQMMETIRTVEASGICYPNWKPAMHPYRLCLTVTAPYPANWRDYTCVFATEGEALAALEHMMPKGANYATVCIAMNPENWGKGMEHIDAGAPWWRQIAKRAPRKATVLGPGRTRRR